MKKIFLSLAFIAGMLSCYAQGLPFIRNYTAKEYGAHNRNFDIDIGLDGTIYIANFEGLLYFDHAKWQVIHTPGIARVTVVKRVKDGTIFVGGYSFFGKVIKDKNGTLHLQQIGESDLFSCEVLEIWEETDHVFFMTNEGKVYQLDNDKIVFKKLLDGKGYGEGVDAVVDLSAVSEGEMRIMSDVIQTLDINANLKVLIKDGNGLAVTDGHGHEMYSIKEENGLCSNVVNYLAYDGKGQIWGVTDNGIFTLNLPSVYTHFTANEGITGEVLSMEYYQGRMLIGTNNGLLYQSGKRFVRLDEIRHACWQLLPVGDDMLAATSSGVYRLSPDLKVQLLFPAATMALFLDGQSLYCGCADGIYLVRNDGQQKKVCSMEYVNKFLKDAEGSLWVQSINGQVSRRLPGEQDFTPYGNADKKMVATIVRMGRRVAVVDALANVPFPYPQFSYTDSKDVTWLTDNTGKNLYAWKDGEILHQMDSVLYPIREKIIHSFYRHENELWVGGLDGVTLINTTTDDPSLQHKPQLYIRSFVLEGDSVLWGGYGKMPKEIHLSHDQRHVSVTYALSHEPIVGTTYYRYRLNDGNWSNWSEEHVADFINLPYGSYTLAVQARYAMGRESEISELRFNVAYPFYMRWYMNVLYVILFILLVFSFFRYRLKKLRQDKIKLEKIVSERTSEIQEKSKSLEKALDDLGNAQHELIRQEKMATVGKLTQGLIDRILNPLNYINNFSKLSEGLVKDLEANIDDDKDKMDAENYEDTKDVLDMLRGNLMKVSEHGQNTTRTLKAMEEMLKDRTGGYEDMDLVPILKQDKEMVCNYYAKEIAQYQVKVLFDIPEESLFLHGNADLLSKTLMSLLGNGMYAIVKKVQRMSYDACLSLKAAVREGQIVIQIRDTGIGIEETIIDKIFDPFFTTKTTGEAAGVGLYLSREIIQNHGGDIQVESVKNEYSEFTITIPALKK